MKVIENVFKYQLRIDNIACYSQNNNIYNIYDFNGYLLNSIEVEDCHWFFQDEKFLQIGNNGKLGYFSEDVFVKPLLNYYRPIVNNIGVFHDYTNSDGRTHKEMLFALPEEQQILSEWLPNRIFHVQDQYWANDTEEDFKLIDVERGKVLWTIPQPNVEKPYGYNGLTSIKKVLGIYKDCLWLQLPDSRLLVLDIDNGFIKHELKHDYYIVHERGTFFDSKEGVLKIFFYNLYAKYSLELMDFVEEYDLGIPELFQATSMISIPNDKYIYYTAKLNDVSMISNAYGIFDSEKKEIVFQGEEIEEGGCFYQEPQVNDELFTILDAKGNLIIHRLTDIL
ncbi:hypothetical protein [Myroides odoratus]|uniref:Uncharacterized protein n=1 Tax=Myroides odoratus TaxID=256 RepID=A0A9Q7E8X7_MYROD|nr:hypothetical protein [Myroides odoratus]EHQ43864.1 hypothetical protein Myrod_3045 [Myroides odoratus DSM 2801]EKB04864.1 hypothetical protein HMPREF9716_03052 [Myroides odoratus CIP 103059]QQU01171.1 hypothetical protein I6I88_05310 [Myroides odoratus]WQD56573.1 hypothetical protein U0010_13720 [Myroides odoratus]STZ31141.1 Uncharacterised protein [Myroides odoratus]